MSTHPKVVFQTKRHRQTHRQTHTQTAGGRNEVSMSQIKSYRPNRQKDTHTHRHYENITSTAHVGGNNLNLIYTPSSDRLESLPLYMWLQFIVTPGTDAYQLAELCAGDITPPYLSGTDNATVHFTSDRSVTDFGFVALVQAGTWRGLFLRETKTFGTKIIENSSDPYQKNMKQANRSNGKVHYMKC